MKTNCIVRSRWYEVLGAIQLRARLARPGSIGKFWLAEIEETVEAR